MKSSIEEIHALLDFVLPISGIADQKDSIVALTLALNVDFNVLLKKRILAKLHSGIEREIHYADLIFINDKILRDGGRCYRKNVWPKRVYVAFECDKNEIAVGIIFPTKVVLQCDGLDVAPRIIRDKLRIFAGKALTLCNEQAFSSKNESDEWAGWINWTPNSLRNDAFIEFALHSDAHARKIANCIDGLAGAIDLVLSEFTEIKEAKNDS